MKTMKRLLAALLCVCLLTGTLVISGSAADAQQPTQIYLPDPKAAVTKAEGLIVYEMTFDFDLDYINVPTEPEDPTTPGEADDDDANETAPIFTGFDENAVLEGEVLLFAKSTPALATFTAKPVAYDAQSGLLTVSLFGEDGSAGVKMFAANEKIENEINLDPDLFSRLEYSIDKINRDYFGRFLKFNFSFPQAMLKGNGTESMQKTVGFFSSDIQNIPLRDVSFLGKTTHRNMERIIKMLVAYIQKHGPITKEQITDTLLYKLSQLLMAGVDDLGHKKFSFKAFLSVSAVLIILPSFTPYIIHFLRGIRTVAREYDSHWNLIKWYRAK